MNIGRLLTKEKFSVEILDDNMDSYGKYNTFRASELPTKPNKEFNVELYDSFKEEDEKNLLIQLSESETCYLDIKIYDDHMILVRRMLIDCEILNITTELDWATSSQPSTFVIHLKSTDVTFPHISYDEKAKKILDLEKSNDSLERQVRHLKDRVTHLENKAEEEENLSGQYVCIGNKKYRLTSNDT